MKRLRLPIASLVLTLGPGCASQSAGAAEQSAPPRTEAGSVEQARADEAPTVPPSTDRGGPNEGSVADPGSTGATSGPATQATFSAKEAFGHRASEVLAVTLLPERSAVAIDLRGDAGSLDDVLADARFAYDNVMTLPKAKGLFEVEVTYANSILAYRSLLPEGFVMTAAGDGLVFIADPADFEIHAEPSADRVTKGDYSGSWVTCKGTVTNAGTAPLELSVRCSAFATKLGTALRGTADQTRLVGESTVSLGEVSPGETKTYKTKVKGELPTGFSMEEVSYLQEVLTDGRAVVYYDIGMNRRNRRFIEMASKLRTEGFDHRALDDATFHVDQGFYNFRVEPGFFKLPQATQQKRVDVLWSAVSKYLKKNFERKLHTLYLSDGTQTRTVDGGTLKKKK